MDHLKDFWFHELRLMREALLGDGEGFILTHHTVDERMGERKIEIVEIAEVILTGTILEGWDVCQYPHFRNRDPLRTIVGRTSTGRILTVGVAISDKFRVTTVYEGVTNRLLNAFAENCPEWYREYTEARSNQASAELMM